VLSLLMHFVNKNRDAAIKAKIPKALLCILIILINHKHNSSKLKSCL
jgi:hypothetical protein